MHGTSGWLDDKGTPLIKIHIGGVHQPKEFSAIIDTGFSGFLSMPIMQAFPLGLPLYTTTNVELADGKIHDKLVAQGRVTFAGDTKFGLIILEQESTEILLGMGFLKLFSQTLFVGKDVVLLIPEAEIEKLKQQQQKGEALEKSAPENSAEQVVANATLSPSSPSAPSQPL